MRGIRVQTASNELFIDVVCDCGNNGLTDKITGETSFKHSVVLGTEERKTLFCPSCKSEYLIRPQGNHVHVEKIKNNEPSNDPILFYEGKWYFFSNFSSFKVLWRGIHWMTSEHAYQAARFSDQKIAAEIMNAPSAHEAKKIARKHLDEQIENWDEIKLAVMEEIVRAKLEQHPYIKRKLLETGSKEIVENSPKDSFWGRGPNWNGQNNLGKIWMKLRSELQKNQ